MYSYCRIPASLGNRLLRSSMKFKGRPVFSSLSFPSPRYTKGLEDEFLKSMQAFRKDKSPKKLLQHVEKVSTSSEFTPNMTFIALRALQRMNRSDLSVSLLPYWKQSMESRGSNNSVDIVTAVGMVRLFCRLQDMDNAQEIASSVGVRLTEQDSPATSSHDGTELTEEHITYTKSLHQQLLPELALGYISVGSTYKALNLLQQMEERELTIEPELSRRIFKQFLVLAKPDTILQAMNALLSINGLADNDSVQLITNYYFRHIDFITGAVSLPTLPPPTVPEVCFIGRSNVGKSSLINMICNRKGVAFTSKRPGKTSEFNYFAVNGVIGVDKQPQRFHMVDLPGVGFAKQRQELRASWTKLLSEFVAQRDTLRVIYHLVDSRHGLLDADEECLSLLETLPARTQYVIVLTKVDKQRSAEKFSHALDGIIDKIYSEVAKRTDMVVPIVLTSSETKLGAADMLVHMLEAVAPSAPENRQLSMVVDEQLDTQDS